MSELTSVDRNPLHLFPPFRAKITQLLQLVQARTGEPWVIAEGYRSQARQLWLYGQGRPGIQPYGRPGKVVTWKRAPTWHGTGIAVDLRPARGYDVPHHYWETLHALLPQFGLANPAWGNGDLGHVQWTDYGVRQRSLNWIAAGRPETERNPVVPGPDEPGLLCTLNGRIITDADPRWTQPGATEVRVRPVIQARGGDVLAVDRTKGTVTVVIDDQPETPQDEGVVVTLPVTFIGDHAYASSHDLAMALSLRVGLNGSGARKTVAFSS